MATPATSSSSSASATGAPPPAPSRAPASNGRGGERGDNDSAALLWTLRANAVTPSKDPASSVGFTTPNATGAAPSRAAAATPSSAISKTGSTPPSARRGPGRPKKSEGGTKSAAKWDDDVTAQLLTFRYDSMRGEFEGVRNNVEVGECWIKLAQELSRLSGKAFDSHQCQSKLRNLKKSWREMQAEVTRANTASPLYPLMSRYLGGNDSSATAADSASATDATPRTRTGRSSSKIAPGEKPAVAREHVAESSRAEAGSGEDNEEREDDSLETASVDTEELVAAVAAVERTATASKSGRETGLAGAGRHVPEAPAPKATTRARSESMSSTSSVSPLPTVAPLSKRQKRISLAPEGAAATGSAVDSIGSAISAADSIGSTISAAASAPALSVDAAVAPLLAGGVLPRTDGGIDSSLLSVANGLRTMMEGVIASKEDSSEQQLLLAELRKHNALMKKYCEEMSKQTTSLNALIDLLTANFGSGGGAQRVQL